MLMILSLVWFGHVLYAIPGTLWYFSSNCIRERTCSSFLI